MARGSAKDAMDTVTLPPPGDERREVLAARTDELDERAEQLAGELEVERIDSAKLKVESELAQHFDELDVSGALPEFHYCWVQSGFNGRFVKIKLTEGWAVVQGNDPEALDLKGMGADTTRRLGDVILMRIRLDRYVMLQRREKAKRVAREEGITTGLREMGRDAGVIVHVNDEMSDATLKRMQMRQQARATAGATTDKWLREGRMPGVATPASNARP